MLVLLAAEARSLYVIRDTHAAGNPRLTIAGLAWGFVAIGALAVFGLGRARVTTEIKVPTLAETEAIVQIGLGNQFGDRAVQPLVMYLFSKDAKVVATQADGGARRDPSLHLASIVRTRDAEVPVQYHSTRLELIAGDWTLSYFAVERAPHPILIVVRADHTDLPKGRVESAGWLMPDGEFRALDFRTT